MKTFALALAAGGLLALSAPAFATIETPEAIITATDAASDAHADMVATFGMATLENGKFEWKDGDDSGTLSRVVISRKDQMIYAYRDDELVGVSTISSGRKGHPTPVGIFPILQKERYHRSKKYDDAPMPYMQRLDDYGIAMHAGNLPGKPASHGCIRLPAQFAAKLFAATEVGTEVMIGA